jgi:hypothetical protein
MNHKEKENKAYSPYLIVFFHKMEKPILVWNTLCALFLYTYFHHFCFVGMNGLTDFKEFAAKNGWIILATEHFAVSPSTHKINATKGLLRLRERGTRVVILNCLAAFVPAVLEQAKLLDMIDDWVWILTDGAIAKVCYFKVIEILRQPIVLNRNFILMALREDVSHVGQCSEGC